MTAVGGDRAFGPFRAALGGDIHAERSVAAPEGRDIVALAIGMRVLAWAPRTPRDRIRETGVVACGSLEDLLAASDVVTLHLPLTILTPHTAWLSPESEVAAYEIAARSITDVLVGRPPRHRVA